MLCCLHNYYKVKLKDTSESMLREECGGVENILPAFPRDLLQSCFYTPTKYIEYDVKFKCISTNGADDAHFRVWNLERKCTKKKDSHVLKCEIIKIH